MAYLDGFVVMAVGGTAALHLLPEAFEAGGWLSALFAILGVCLPSLLERILAGVDGRKVAIILVAGILPHAALESAVLAMSTGPDTTHLGSAIAVHRIPMAIIVFSVVTVYYGQHMAWLSVALITFVTSCGFFAAEFMLVHASIDDMSWLKALVGGALLHVIFSHQLGDEYTTNGHSHHLSASGDSQGIETHAHHAHSRHDAGEECHHDHTNQADGHDHHHHAHPHSHRGHGCVHDHDGDEGAGHDHDTHACGHEHDQHEHGCEHSDEGHHHSNHHASLGDECDHHHSHSGHHHHDHHHAGGPCHHVGETHGSWTTLGAVSGAFLVIPSLVHTAHGHGHSVEDTRFIDTLFTLLVESAPALLIAYVLAGLVRAFFSPATAQWLGRGSRTTQAGKGVLFGLPLPICSCGVLPVYESLVRRGVPATAAMGFLVATPELGIDAILISLPLLGADMTIARLIAAFCVALLAALIVGRWQAQNSRSSRMLQGIRELCNACSRWTGNSDWSNSSITRSLG